MSKRQLTYVAIIIAVVLIGVLIKLYSDETAAKVANPRYHTVKEGDFCSDKLTDCESGLTCVSNICQKL